MITTAMADKPKRAKSKTRKASKKQKSQASEPKDDNQKKNVEPQESNPGWISLDWIGPKDGTQVEMVRIREHDGNENPQKPEAKKGPGSANRDSVENASTLKLGEHISDKERKRKMEKNKQAIEDIIKILQDVNPRDIDAETKADLIRIHILVRGIHIRNAQWHVAQDQRQVEEMMRKLNARTSQSVNPENPSPDQAKQVNVVVIEMEKDDGKRQGGRPCCNAQQPENVKK